MTHMLRVTIDVVPAGDDTRKRTIGILEISRTTLNNDPEDYKWRLVTFKDSIVERSTLDGHVSQHLKSDGAYDLIRRAFELICGVG